MSIVLAPPSSPSIPAGGQVTQQLQVSNPDKAALKMKLMISFVTGGLPITEQLVVANFPQVLYNSS